MTPNLAKTNGTEILSVAHMMQQSSTFPSRSLSPGILSVSVSVSPLPHLKRRLQALKKRFACSEHACQKQHAFQKQSINMWEKQERGNQVHFVFLLLEQHVDKKGKYGSSFANLWKVHDPQVPATHTHTHPQHPNI